jgi:poly-gamma-glutamate synthesis protein (capsule biosynthesis protein)
LGKIVVTAVGDLMLGDGPLNPGFGVASYIRNVGGDSLFKVVKPILERGDIVFGNLEAVLACGVIGKTASNHRQLIGSPSSVSSLKQAGFNVLSIANNHALEHGNTAMLDTIEHLKKEHIRTIGQNLEIIEIKGTKVALLAYCLIEDSTAYTSTVNPDQICSQIKKAKSETSLVIVSMHWGDEFIHRPSLRQIELAHKMIDSGASLIIGHHPHVVQGIEMYNNGLIAYSLGNFVFDMGYIPETRNSFILECSLTYNGKMDDYNLFPIYINDAFQPVPLSGVEREQALGEIERLSRYTSEREENYSESYEVELLSRRKRARNKMKLQFIKNIYRYPFGFTVKVMADYARKIVK